MMNRKPRSRKLIHSTSARFQLFTCVLLAACGCNSLQTLDLKPSRRAMRAAPNHSTQMMSQPKATALATATRPPNAKMPAAKMPAAKMAAAKMPTANMPAATMAASRHQPASDVMPVSYTQDYVISDDQSHIAGHAPMQFTGEQPCVNEGQACGAGATCSTCEPSIACAPPQTGPVPPYWNDQEYLYDGGDREPRAQVTEDWNLRGLDSQDTIAHYETVDGKVCVAPSNRVPIYAPRFGAVRKTTAPILAARAVGALRVVDPNAAVVRSNRDLTGDMTGPVGPRNQNSVKLIDGLRERTRGVPAEKFIEPINLTNFQAALNRLQKHTAVLRSEMLREEIGQYMVNARTWTNTDAIAIELGGIVAHELRDEKQVQDVHVYESEPGKCSLRICKAASHSAATPGDIIQFSIRFDNVGVKPIGNLVIQDSLVTRLEYIDGSQQCVLSLGSMKGAEESSKFIRFSTAENEAGSTVLKWEVDQPLETGDSGVITFRCRVR